jgi:hypothetical protein
MAIWVPGIFPGWKGVKGGRCVGLTTLPPLCDNCHEIWEPHLLEPSGPLQVWTGIYLLNCAVISSLSLFILMTGKSKFVPFC